MNTIENTLRPEELLRIYGETIKGVLKREGDHRLAEMIEESLNAYQAEKSLLEKTADWHEHGTVAPSCVGCPTAKAMIEGDDVIREITIKASCENCRHSYQVPVFGWGLRLQCPHRTARENRDDVFGLCKRWLPVRKSIANMIIRAKLKE